MKPRLRSAAALALYVAAVLVLGGCSAQSAEEHMASARSYLAAGEDDAAIIELKNALKKDAALPEARAELAELLFASGDYRAAAADYRRAIDLYSDANATTSPRRRELNNALNLCKIRLRQAAEVISDLTSASSSLAGDELAVLGHARLALDDSELAQQDFSNAITQLESGSRSFSLAQYGLALIAARAGDTERAKDSFERAVAEGVEGGTRDPAILLGKADFELSQNDFAAASETFGLARALPGNDLPARLGAVRVLIFEADFASATAELESILSIAPDLIPAIYLQALVAYEQGDLDSAQLYLRRVLSNQTGYAQALYLMGAVQFQQKEFLQAETNLSSYVARNPGASSGRKLLGAVRMQTGNFEGVVTALEPVSESSSDAQTLAMLGTAYARLGQLNNASRLLDRAVELAPDVGELRNQLAVTLLAAGDSDQAIGQLESAIELDGELQLSDYLLVLAQLRSGKIDEALLAANALRERAPDDPMGENLLGAVRFAQGDIEGARAAFISSLAKDESFQPAALNLVRLELSQGNRDAALNGLQALLDADPDNERALLQLAELEIEAIGDPQRNPTAIERDKAIEQAKVHLLQAARAHDESLAPRLALARLELFAGNARSAVTQSTQALQLAPDNPGVLAVHVDALLKAGDRKATAGPLKLLERLVLSSKATPASLLTLADLLARAGQEEQAIAVYEDLVGAPDKYSDPAKMALLRADLKEGDLEGARTRLLQVSAAAQSSAVYRALRADLMQAEGDTAGARSVYEALLGEGHRDALFRLVSLHNAAGDTQKSAAVLESWVKRYPEDKGAELAFANNALNEGDYSTAQARFEAVLETAPDNVVVLNNLAWLYQQTGDTRARETAQRAWSLAPANADVADTYGWILVGAGDLESGRDVLVKANRLAPRSLSIAYHAASALADTGRNEQALAVLREFDLEPGSEGGQDSVKSAALALFLKLVAVDQIEVEAK